MTGQSIAIPLPRIRRLRRPPARLVYQGGWVLLCVVWVIYAALRYAQNHDRVFQAIVGSFWVFALTKEYRALMRLWGSWREGERLREVAREEWRSLMIGWLIMALLLPYLFVG